MSWQASVERVLWMRRVARLEAEKAELIRIIQETERRCKVVVNRQQSEVLKDVPSWKSAQPAVPHEPGKPRSFRRGMRTWGEQRKRLEKEHRKETDRRERRQEEFEQVLSGTFPLPAQAVAPAVYTNTEESSDVEQPAAN